MEQGLQFTMNRKRKENTTGHLDQETVFYQNFNELLRNGTQFNRKRSLEVVPDTPTLIVLSGELKKQFPEFTYSYREIEIRSLLQLFCRFV